jgi:hypothetical protein
VRRIVMIALSVMFALVVAIPIASGATALRNDSQTLGALGAEWWTWAIEEPVPTNAQFGSYTDKSPKCEGSTTFANQEVFFLSGTQTGEPVTRECTVSSEAWIFFPVVNYVDIEPIGALTEDAIRQIVNDAMDQYLAGSTMYVTVDGKRVPVSIQKNRADTPLFTVTLPRKNIFGGPQLAGEYEGVADGVWMLLPPLSEGEHTITFGGAFPNAPGDGFSQNNTYILTVV